MGMRRIFVVLALLLFGAQARAHEHKMEALLGGSVVDGSALGGVDFSYVLYLPKLKGEVKRTTDWALFADFGTNWGSHEGEARTQVAATMGLRRVFPLRKAHTTLIQPYLHGEVAYVRTQDEGASGVDKVGGYGLGGGVDFCFIDRRSVCARVQGDYLWLEWSKGTVPSYARLSFGVVFRIGCYHKDKQGNCVHD
jgi:hypothetical protein